MRLQSSIEVSTTENFRSLLRNSAAPWDISTHSCLKVGCSYQTVQKILWRKVDVCRRRLKAFIGCAETSCPLKILRGSLTRNWTWQNCVCTRVPCVRVVYLVYLSSKEVLTSLRSKRKNLIALANVFRRLTPLHFGGVKVHKPNSLLRSFCHNFSLKLVYTKFSVVRMSIKWMDIKEMECYLSFKNCRAFFGTKR